MAFLMQSLILRIAMLMILQDSELWFASGDCLVHFYAQGHSRRGASLRVSLAAIASSNCGPLLEQYSAKADAGSPSAASDRSTSSDEDYFNDPSPPAKHELFIPAPSGLTRDDAFRFHLTTRNFFAWMFEKPLVGDRLGDSLLSLLDRMNEFRSDEDENLEDVLAYIDSQEYTDFRSCPDHALAVLRFAEKNELLELWRDSFCHCAGMSDELQSSAEIHVWNPVNVRYSLISNIVCSSCPVNRKPSSPELTSKWTSASKMLVDLLVIFLKMTSQVPIWGFHRCPGTSGPLPLFSAVLLCRQIRILASDSD